MRIWTPWWMLLYVFELSHWCKTINLLVWSGWPEVSEVSRGFQSTALLKMCKQLDLREFLNRNVWLTWTLRNIASCVALEKSHLRCVVLHLQVVSLLRFLSMSIQLWKLSNTWNGTISPKHHIIPPKLRNYILKSMRRPILKVSIPKARQFSSNQQSAIRKQHISSCSTFLAIINSGSSRWQKPKPTGAVSAKWVDNTITSGGAVGSSKIYCWFQRYATCLQMWSRSGSSCFSFLCSGTGFARTCSRWSTSSLCWTSESSC